MKEKREESSGGNGQEEGQERKRKSVAGSPKEEDGKRAVARACGSKVELNARQKKLWVLSAVLSGSVGRQSREASPRLPLTTTPISQ